MGQLLYTYDDPPSERDMKRAVKALEDDGVLAYPTDLNWAFGCGAASPKALDRIHLLKPTHPRDLPFSLICSSISMAADFATIESGAYRVLKKAWPGPFTVLLPATRQLPRQLKDKRRVVGIRIPSCPLMLAIIDRFGHPLANTSVPPLTATDPPRFGYEVYEAYGHAVDLVLDLGHELPGLESTIIDWTETFPRVVRRGAGDPAPFEAAAKGQSQ